MNGGYASGRNDVSGCGHIVVYRNGDLVVCQTGLTFTVTERGRRIRKTVPCGMQVKLNGCYQLVGHDGENEIYLLNGDSIQTIW